MKQNLKHLSFYFFLPIFLLLFAFFNVFNYLKTKEFGILNLDVRGNINQLASIRSGELLKGDIVYGKFHSSYPNLGIISVRFYNQDRDSDDTLLFKLKEEGQDDWYYEAKYKTDQFMPHKHFPFGFPVISDSEGKNFEFQIESLRGATGSGILVDMQSPVFIAKSTFNKNDLLENNKSLLNFLGKKFINVFGETDSRLAILIYFLPFIFYAFFIVSKGVGFQFLTGIALAVVIYDIFWLRDSYDSLFIALIFLWTLTSRRFNFESRIAGVFSLGFLVMTPTMLVIGKDALSEKFAVWAYLFICITVVQQVYELKMYPKNQFTLKKLKNNLFKFQLDKNNKFALIFLCIFKLAIVIFSVYLLFTALKKLYETFQLYQLFFQRQYLAKYLVEIVFPFMVILTGSILVLVKIRNKFRSKLFLCFLITLLVSLLNNLVIKQFTRFSSYPTVFLITPNGSSEAWTDTIVFGRNFQSKPYEGRVVIDGYDQRIIDWSDSRVIFRTNPGQTKSGTLCIETFLKGKTNCKEFIYNYK